MIINVPFFQTLSVVGVCDVQELAMPVVSSTSIPQQVMARPGPDAGNGKAHYAAILEK